MVITTRVVKGVAAGVLVAVLGAFVGCTDSARNSGSGHGPNGDAAGGEGINGIQVGSTREAVLGALGKPSIIGRLEGERWGGTQVAELNPLGREDPLNFRPSITWLYRADRIQGYVLTGTETHIAFCFDEHGKVVSIEPHIVSVVYH